MRIMKSVLAILLLVCILTSCNLSFVSDLVSQIIPEHSTPETTTESTPESNTTPAEPTEEDFYPEPIKQLLANNQPYSLEFTSNGDGTCYVSRLYLNNQYETMFDVIIPEKSPTGDVVTGIDLGDSLTNPHDVVPKYLIWERAAKIADQVKVDYPNEQGGMVREWWINAYQEYNPSKMSPGMREEILKRLPILEYVPIIGAWYTKMSNLSDTFARLQYADITPSVAKQYYEELMQEAREAGAPEEILTPYKELMEAVPVYANYSDRVRYLHIPSTVTNINMESLSYLMFSSIDEEKSLARGVVLPPLGLEATLEIYDTFADSLGLRSPSKRTFIIFSHSMSAEGYEELPNFAVYSAEEPENDVLAWHYVDGVPTLWK